MKTRQSLRNAPPPRGSGGSRTGTEEKNKTVGIKARKPLKKEITERTSSTEEKDNLQERTSRSGVAADEKVKKQIRKQLIESAPSKEKNEKVVEGRAKKEIGIKAQKLERATTASDTDKVEEEVIQPVTVEEVKTKKQAAAAMLARKELAKAADSNVEAEKNQGGFMLVVPDVKNKTPRSKIVRMQLTEPTEPTDSDSSEQKIEEEEKENVTLEQFYQMIKKSCVLSERWVLNAPKEDIALKTDVILVIEIDITIDGDMRVKRCVKILDDRSFKVLLDNVDMTHLFDVNKKIATTNDAVNLLYNVQMKKICQGLRSFTPNNTLSSKETYPVRLRGTIWYSKDCTVVVQKVFMGNSCSACAKIRNQIKRKVQSETRRKMQAKPAIKQSKRSFGKAVYSALNDFIGKGVIPSSQYPRQNMVYDEKLEVYMNQELQNRLETAASMPPPPPPPPVKVSARPNNRKRYKSSNNRGNRYSQSSVTMTSAGASGIQGMQEFITEDGQLCYVITDPSQAMTDPITGLTSLGEQFQLGQMVVEKFEPSEMDEMVGLGDHENIIIQNIKGETFTLAEGQEYELIGEAQPADDSMELVSADNQQIQIIEVDDETLAQIQLHEGMDNMQIAHVDPNDPNFRQLLRAFQDQGMAL